MKRLLLSFFACILLLSPLSSYAQEEIVPGLGDDASVETSISASSEDGGLFLARVEQILEEGERKDFEYTEKFQRIIIRFITGPDKNTAVEITNGGVVSVGGYRRVEGGDVVVINKINTVSGETAYYLVDLYRLPALVFIAFLFGLLVIVFGRSKGAMSLLGLATSVIILVWFMAPHIIKGDNPLLISIAGVSITALISLYLAHGFNKRTTLSLISTFATLILALGMSFLFTYLTRLSGLGSEDAFTLQFGVLEKVNFKWLFMGGIMIGTLGVLDDITTAQTAVVAELKHANPNLTFKELYKRGINVGKEHIASLVNTLVFAYAGASLPLLLLFTIDTGAPLWMIFNSEAIAEEIIRTLVGSSSLIFAVPISTLLAAYVLSKGSSKYRDALMKEAHTSHTHHH